MYIADLVASIAAGHYNKRDQTRQQEAPQTRTGWRKSPSNSGIGKRAVNVLIQVDSKRQIPPDSPSQKPAPGERLPHLRVSRYHTSSYRACMPASFRATRTIAMA